MTMLTIPVAIYLVGLLLVVWPVMRQAGADTTAKPGRLAFRRGLAWTGIWALLFLLYILILGLGSFGL